VLVTGKAGYQEEDDAKDCHEGTPLAPGRAGLGTPGIKQGGPGHRFLLTAGRHHPQGQAAINTEFLSGEGMGSAAGARPNPGVGSLEQLPADLTEPVLLPVHQVTVAAISHFSRTVDELSQTSL
jgi:hypothetical protein